METEYLREKLIESGIDVDITDEQINKLNRFYEMVVEKNKVMNLTGITEYHEFVEKHFIDSLMLYKAENISNKKVIDVGTGAGFPGIPLKIVYPSCNMTLMDSLNKRLIFLDEVIDELGLKDIKTVHARAEELAHKDDYREKFDICVSRAVARLATLNEYCIPFVKVGGSFISYKSGDFSEELEESKKSISILGAKLKNTIAFNVPGSDIKRSLIVIEKIKNTSSKYPRQAGKPGKEPLV